MVLQVRTATTRALPVSSARTVVSVACAQTEAVATPSPELAAVLPVLRDSRASRSVVAGFSGRTVLRLATVRMRFRVTLEVVNADAKQDILASDATKVKYLMFIQNYT